MALTDQPYIPFYVDDWMNNNKLKLCSPATHGIMISIMCIMHKEPTYGKILLKQKFKQTDKQISNFALQVARQTAFDLLDVEPAICELVEEQVLVIEEDFLICRRMVKDAEISAKRASSGGKGGKKTQEKNKEFAQDFAKANLGANSVNENEYGNKDSIGKESAGAEDTESNLSDEERLVKARENNPKQFPVPSDFNGLPEMKVGVAVEYLRIAKKPDITPDEVRVVWEMFKQDNLTGKNFYKDEDDVYSHFIKSLKYLKFDLNATHKQSHAGAPSAGAKSFGAEKLADRVVRKHGLSA
jgi:hypothetical protein